MFFIPFNTDAPLYYRPLGTVGLIVLNVIVFVIGLSNPDLTDSWMLYHGVGLTPLAWVTSNFVHAGIMHLLGNMLFLWGFGLLVEGKLGWYRFVPLYLLIGGLECLVEQVFIGQGGSASCGASAAIFGLMAISLIWAPRNELSVFFWILTRVGVIEISVLWFAGLKFALSTYFFVMSPDTSSELLHLMGAAIGAVLGLTMLLTRRVDCEGWDLLSVTTGNIPSVENAFSYGHQQDRARRQKRRHAKRRRPQEKNVADNVPQKISSIERFQTLVESRKFSAAHQELLRVRDRKPEFQPQADELLALARGLRRLRQWDDCVSLYEEFLRQRPDFSLARVELAEILVLIQTRPSAARRLLEPCDIEQLSPKQQQKLATLQRHIQSQLESGVIEMKGHSW